MVSAYISFLHLALLLLLLLLFLLLLLLSAAAAAAAAAAAVFSKHQTYHVALLCVLSDIEAHGGWKQKFVSFQIIRNLKKTEFKKKCLSV